MLLTFHQNHVFWGRLWVYTSTQTHLYSDINRIITSRTSGSSRSSSSRIFISRNRSRYIASGIKGRISHSYDGSFHCITIIVNVPPSRANHKSVNLVKVKASTYNTISRRTCYLVGIIVPPKKRYFLQYGRILLMDFYPISLWHLSHDIFAFITERECDILTSRSALRNTRRSIMYSIINILRYPLSSNQMTASIIFNTAKEIQVDDTFCCADTNLCTLIFIRWIYGILDSRGPTGCGIKNVTRRAIFIWCNRCIRHHILWCHGRTYGCTNTSSFR